MLKQNLASSLHDCYQKKLYYGIREENQMTSL